MRPSLRAWDWHLLGAALGLTVVSVITITSASARLNPVLAWRQLTWALIGIGACLAVARMPISRWTELAGLAYGLGVILLVLVCIAGTTKLGATRWLSVFGLSLQPTELVKLGTVWLLARYLAGQPTPLPTRAVVTSLLLAGLPALLIFRQPDLGSATILAAIWLGMAWVSGLSRRHAAVLAGAMLGLAPLAWHILKPYQRGRLLAFINPHADPLGAGYTVIQSQIAIGSGQWVGRGWFAGTQNQLNFLPERHSDFIFSVVGEEWGLLGCLVVVAAFVLLLARVLDVALRTGTPHGRLLAVGVFAWVGYQAFVNLGMVSGLLPVVGVPLPLMSYGGTSMVALWIGLGTVLGTERTEEGMHPSPWS